MKMCRSWERWNELVKARPTGHIFTPSCFCAGWASVPSHEQREETGPGVLTLLCLSYLLKLSEVGVESLKGILCLNVLFLRGFSNSRQHLSHQPRPSKCIVTSHGFLKGLSGLDNVRGVLQDPLNSLFHKLCLSSQNQHTIDCCKYLDKYGQIQTNNCWGFMKNGSKPRTEFE